MAVEPGSPWENGYVESFNGELRDELFNGEIFYAGKTHRRIVAAWIGTAFAQEDAAAARKQWREVADQARTRVPKLAALMDEAKADVLRLYELPRAAQGKTPLDQSARAPQRRDQAARRRGRDIPVRGRRNGIPVPQLSDADPCCHSPPHEIQRTIQ